MNAAIWFMFGVVVGQVLHMLNTPRTPQ